MSGLPQRFFDLARRDGLLADNQHVLVACSGGLDSTVLLFLLRFFSPPGVRLSAAHFDHGMRPDSEADADWVTGLCAAWDVPLHRRRAARALSSEADAREARYQFLQTTAQHVGAERIALAHHADDQVETVVFRLMRGTGLDGLAGIPARRGHIVRPLLGVARADLEVLARNSGLSWREDPTNASRKYARNRIRLDVLPALETARPDVRQVLAALAERAARVRERRDALLSQVEKNVVTVQDANRIELARSELLKYHPEIQTHLLRRLSARLTGTAPGRAGTATLAAFITAGASGSGIHTKGGLRVEREFDTIRLNRGDNAADQDRPLAIHLPLPGTGEASLGGTRYTIQWTLGPAGDSHNAIAIDPAAVNFPVEIRAWRAGDRIRLPYGTKKLKKLFAERRLGAQRRATLPVLADRDGNVLWVAGLVRAALAQPAHDGSAFRITVMDGQPG